MISEITNKYQGEANIFKALSHPTRLFILHTIKENSYSVSQLAEMVGIDISTMSKHLNLLKKLNLIKGKKERNTIYYQPTIMCLFDFMRCAQKITKYPNEYIKTPCIQRRLQQQPTS